MEKDIKTLLDENISEELNNLDQLEMGSEEYKIAVDGITKLLDKKIEIEKLGHQTTADKSDLIFKNALAVANIVIPSAITIWGTFKTLKFEETGTVTTIMGRGFVNKLIPKK